MFGGPNKLPAPLFGDKSQTGQPVFGSNVPNASSFGSSATVSHQPSSFGQIGLSNQNVTPGFGQISQQNKNSFVQSNPVNVQVGQGFGQTGFGTSHTTRGNTFGQDATGFGQSSLFTGASSGFGQNTTPSVFGQTSLGSSQTSTGGSGGFSFSATSGNTQQTNLFPNTGSEAKAPVFPVQSAAKQDSVFGRVSSATTTNTTSVFGGQPKVSSGFGGTAVSGTLFGGNVGTSAGSSSSVFPVQTTKKDNLFGAPETSTSSSIFTGQSRPTPGLGEPSLGSGHLFGGPTAAGSSATGSGSTITSSDKNMAQTTSLFGGQISSNFGTNFPGFSKSSSSNVFVSSATGSLFGGTANSSKSLKVDVTATTAADSRMFKTLSPPSTKFITSSTLTSTSVLASVTTSASSSSGLFGGTNKARNVPAVKEEPRYEADGIYVDESLERESDGGTASNPFGDPRKRLKGPTVGLFGKPIKTENKKNLFGKEPAKESRSEGLFGKGVSMERRKDGRRPSDDPDEAPQAKRTPIRRLSSVSEDKVALICKNIPAKYNNALFLKRHFGKFGEITRVYPNQNKAHAVIHFKTHEQAFTAKKHGSYIRKEMKPMEIFWSKYTTSSTFQSSLHERELKTKDGIKRRLDEIKDENVKSPSRSSKWLKSEVDNELAGMSGTQDIAEEQVQTLSRPDQIKLKKSALPSTSRQISPTRQQRTSSPTPGTSEETVSSGGVWKSLMNSVAHAAGEKVQILKLRDRIVRHSMKKRSNLATSRAFVGNCVDMCPEKERYDREDKRRLHNFEILPDIDSVGQNPRVDHSRAVKEYSRSSADQEEPLPHELRPLPVLETTMTYLLTEIADEGGEGMWGDWFDFLWNRTRGIRKDLTQQQICECGAAELLEKCVRFHIFCAERLCEEDMHTFDAKINNENMTKCLQTLKEIYHDLWTKHHTYCRNEAEIRGYMILMNLNEGDILRETQQLRADVRNSTFINFALEVYSALNSNNFVRFFRLVRMASFLNACVMHRYFTQIRSKALYTILKAHRKGEQYSIDVLVRTLGFEDPLEAAEFCIFYGLKANENVVILDRSALIEPEESWLPRRSPNLIENKRLVTVGEIINGEKLPHFTLPTPYSSFDDNGKFVGKLDVKLTEFISRDASPQPGSSVSSSSAVHKPAAVSQPAEVKEENVAPQKVVFTNSDVKELAKFMFWEVIDEFCSAAAKDTMATVQALKDISNDICNDILDDVVSQNVSALSKAMYNEVQVLRQKQQKAEKEAMMNRVAVGITSEIIKEVTDQEVLNLATAETREVKAELKRQQIARCSVDVAEDVVVDAVADLVAELTAEVYQKDVVERLQELEEIESCVKLQRAGRYFQYWKKEYVARLKLKRSMFTFPSTPSMASPDTQVDSMIPDRRMDEVIEESFFVNQEARLSIVSAVETSDRQWVMGKALSAHELYQNLCLCKAWQPYDIAKVIGHRLKRKVQRRVKGKLPTNIYWKLLLSLPDENICTGHEQRAMQHLHSWLRSKFTKGSRPRCQGDVLSAYKTKLIEDGENDSNTKLCVCVRSVEGCVNVSDRATVEALMGTSAIIFVLPPGVTDSPKSIYWRNVKQRFDSILKAKPNNPMTSLVIMCPVTADQTTLTDDLSSGKVIEEFFDLDLVGDVYIMDIDYDEDLEEGFDLNGLTASEELCEAIQWLGDHYPSTAELQVCYLRELVDDFLQKHFYTPVLYNLKLRKQSGFLHQKPSDLLTLYNDIITHMSKVLSMKELQQQSWPVPEFSRSNSVNGLPPGNWNAKSQLLYVRQLVSGLELPWLQDMDLENASWSEICDEIWAYIRSVAGEDTGSARVDLVSKVRILLKKIHKDFEDTCYLLEGEDRCEPSSDNVQWTDLITACIDYRLLSTEFLHTPDSDEEELQVVYFESDLRGYKPPHSWKYQESDRDMAGMMSLNTTVKAAVDKVKELRLENSLSQNQSHVDSDVTSVTSDAELNLVQQEQTAKKDHTDYLFELLDAEKRESQKFDAYLQKMSLGAVSSLNRLDSTENEKLFVNLSHCPFETTVDDSTRQNDLTWPAVMSSTELRRHSTGHTLTCGEDAWTSARKVFDSSLMLENVDTEETVSSASTLPLSSGVRELEKELTSLRRSSDIFEKRLNFFLEN